MHLLTNHTRGGALSARGNIMEQFEFEFEFEVAKPWLRNGLLFIQHPRDGFTDDMADEVLASLGLAGQNKGLVLSDSPCRTPTDFPRWQHLFTKPFVFLENEMCVYQVSDLDHVGRGSYLARFVTVNGPPRIYEKTVTAYGSAATRLQKLAQ